MMTSGGTIHYRLMTADDVGNVPILHQGSPQEVLERIRTCGASAMLAYEGEQHVGQLQFRPYVPGTRSPDSLNDPLYWADFGDHVPQLPERTMALFCYHVGQLDDTDVRDPRYFGRGIGTRLLDETLAWMGKTGWDAVVAKAVPPFGALLRFMGGVPAAVYTARGFDCAKRYRDPDLRLWLDETLDGQHGEELQAEIRSLADAGTHLDEAAEVGVCCRLLS
jgi:GNAT superfamily N-acetyltransferase